MCDHVPCCAATGTTRTSQCPTLAKIRVRFRQVEPVKYSDPAKSRSRLKTSMPVQSSAVKPNVSGKPFCTAVAPTKSSSACTGGVPGFVFEIDPRGRPQTVDFGDGRVAECLEIASLQRRPLFALLFFWVAFFAAGLPFCRGTFLATGADLPFFLPTPNCFGRACRG